MTYYTIGEFSKKVGLSINTLRNWDKDGKLKPAYVTDGGHRYYSDDQLNRLIGIKLDKQEKITIGYARVSPHKQKDDLKRQVENIKMYISATNGMCSPICSTVTWATRPTASTISSTTTRAATTTSALTSTRSTTS